MNVYFTSLFIYGNCLSCENHIRDNPFPINIYLYNFYHLGVGYLVGSYSSFRTICSYFYVGVTVA